MAIAIDRNRNVIVNTVGAAHRTGWVLIPLVKDLASLEQRGWCLSRGRGYHTGKMHKTETWGEVIQIDGELTVDKFVQLTGWAPDAEA